MACRLIDYRAICSKGVIRVFCIIQNILHSPQQEKSNKRYAIICYSKRIKGNVPAERLEMDNYVYQLLFVDNSTFGHHCRLLSSGFGVMGILSSI